ncbi:TIGR03790 family protein [Synechococcus sp. ATX 2A4]|uniref:TIGR03790 family protein n=1 Tax=Synechococcus sp. ATX 2A4 TaxID=2823727 RepID=UPI0020CF0428|nr:TIGR03790 family protein [Synechococcus sp. ATX 2A4]
MQGRSVVLRSLLLLAAVAAALLGLTKTGRQSLDGAMGLLDNPALGPLDRRHLALIINAADPLSEALGKAYQARRRLPAAQVIRVRFPAGSSSLSPQAFRALKAEVDQRTPAHVQAYALAWAEPYRVDCLSITTAFAFGYDPRHCAQGCLPTRMNPYFANAAVRRPWDELRIRPTMLLAATSLAQGQRLIERGLAADGTAPAGTGYLLSSSDAARNVRAAGFEQARLALAPTFKVVVLRADALRNANDVMFYFTGLTAVEGLETLQFRPGAIADHLTSFGGQLTDSGQMSALRWLEAGATGSYGTVVEPCNIPAKFPDPGLAMLFYRRGDTLIEAYWRSVAMPGQGVFIGEPLARPWRPQ